MFGLSKGWIVERSLFSRFLYKFADGIIRPFLRLELFCDLIESGLRGRVALLQEYYWGRPRGFSVVLCRVNYVSNLPIRVCELH